MNLQNLPVEILCKIISFLPEKSRRKLNRVSTLFYQCYKSFTIIIKNKHFSNTKKYFYKRCTVNYRKPCNLYGKYVYHECVCEVQERELIGWERY